jgi:hypothetical protein
MTTEPLKDYEERKTTKDTKDTKGTKDMNAAKDAKTEDEKAEKPEPSADGMMAGVIPGAAKKDDAKKLLPVTPWGRYVKILLSSSEFLFVD